MNLADVRAAYAPRRRRKRKGRGIGSGRGQTAGRGTKGQQSRAGGGVRPGFEGGQTVLYRRLPKRGFNNARFRKVYAIINVGRLEGSFDAGASVDAEAIRAARLLPAKGGPVKVLGGGTLTKKLTVRAHRFSDSARRKIEAAGGKVETV
ncbi:MAG: 50S ribosomal protein L15 [Planctomycetota bacterium]